MVKKTTKQNKTKRQKKGKKGKKRNGRKSNPDHLHVRWSLRLLLQVANLIPTKLMNLRYAGKLMSIDPI